MAGQRDEAYTVVEYMRDHSGYKCGYCKSSNTNFSHGMWAHKMSVGDYQDLIDRGWRRSGKYCYKPTMYKTCCPMYTIKCDALALRLSKTQKKVLKRMHRYLSYGDTKQDKAEAEECLDSPVGNSEYLQPKYEAQANLSSVALPAEEVSSAKSVQFPAVQAETNGEDPAPSQRRKGGGSWVVGSGATPPKLQQEARVRQTQGKAKQPCVGPDPSRPACRKAKEVRRERREAKLAKRTQDAKARGESPMQTKKPKPGNVEKTVEDFLNTPLPDNPAHRLELRLVRVNPPTTEFKESYNASYAVFRKYQLQVHGDTESECDKMSYQGFLVDGPLSLWEPGSGPQQGYGSFHHQYWLDGRLIAVGVLDVLPHCLSSVYLYYDPEFSFLSLGTYASLRELALTRELQRRVEGLRWYYMGFYIHSCPKMRYKGRYRPSFLLCPETYSWVPIEAATPKLDVAKYSRLCEDPAAQDQLGRIDLRRIPVLNKGRLLHYNMYQAMMRDEEEEDEEDEVREYAQLAGAKCAYSIILYRS